MPMYKRTRARRPLRRTRRRLFRRARKSPLASKAYVRKLTNKAVEAKRTTSLYELAQDSTTPYNAHIVGQNINVGITDKGRIGNTINLTGIGIRWKLESLWNDSLATNPVVHIVIVEPKNGWFTPASRFWKAFDNGLPNPTEILDLTSMNDGRRVLNTEDLIIHKHYKRTCHKISDQIAGIYTGNCSMKLKRTVKINNNGTGTISPGDVSIPLYVYMFVVLGDEGKYDVNNQFTLSTAVNTYYKD